MKIVSLGLICLLTVNGIGKDNKNNIPINNLKAEFEIYRQETLDVIQTHLIRHPDCELGLLIERVKNVSILFMTVDDTHLKAFCFPPENVVNVFFNSKVEWNNRRAVINLIHELTHITKKPNGMFVCDPDAKPKLGIAVCRLFGDTQYQSKEITEAINVHLNQELEGLNKWKK